MLFVTFEALLGTLSHSPPTVVLGLVRAAHPYDKVS